jgi:hypothetical protein
MVVGLAMTEVIVFHLLIPCTDNATGTSHSPEKFDAWVLETARRFGGITVAGISLQGLWFDPDLPYDANPVEDRSNCYKLGVTAQHVDALREYARDTARRFGQKCLYLERAGVAEFVWDPRFEPN